MMLRKIVICLLFAVLFSTAGYAQGSNTNENGEDREGGILGTGITDADPIQGISSTGLIGVITKLGSIYVNGQYMQFGNETTVTSPLGERAATSLVPGESIAAEAVQNGKDWKALRIHHYLPLIGQVEKSSSDKLSILGSTIDITAETQLVGFENDLKSGDWLAVNGLWKGSNVISTRIEKILPRKTVQITGSYDGDGRDGSFFVGGTRITGLPIKNAEIGNVLTVEGLANGDELEAVNVKKGLFDAKVGTVLMEGYLSEPDETGRYTVYGSGLIFFASGDTSHMKYGRGLYCAPKVGENSIRKVSDLPENKEDRTSFLEQEAFDLEVTCQQ